MEQVIMNLALQYAKSRGLSKITDKALEYAYETLGIEQEEEEYTGGGIYGMKNTFSPKNLMKGAGRKLLSNTFNNAISGGSSGITGALPLFGAALGLGYMTNPLREGSYNYNPNLQGQINYASGRGYIGNNPSSGLMQYGPSSILSGQNVVSGFGTNDYGKQLQNYKDKYGDTMSQERLDQLNKEIEDLTTNDFDEVDAFIEKQTTTNNNNGGGDNNYGGATQSGGFDPGGFEQDGTGRQGYGSGGIASLWQR
jgi:hypothetical protein